MNTESTSIRKGYYGWTGESIVTNVNGYDWSITTMKRSSGKITSSAQAGKKTPNGFNFAMFTDPRKELGFHVGNATEKSIKEAHYKALALFDQLKENNELVQEKQKKEYEIKPGQIIFLNGYGQNENFHDRQVVYNIEKTQWGTSYHYLNIDKLETGFADNIRDIDNKFGIGTYYKKGDVYPLDDKFNNLLIDTLEKEKLEKQRKDASVELAKAEREAKIEEGKKLISIPNTATSIIVAHFKKDDSDSMTDYFSHSEEKTIYLAFSNHNRNLFSEMRAAALNCNDVIHLADLPKDAENRHNYSMGSGYWLGEHLHHGWEIRKETIGRYQENIFIAAAEGRVFFPEFGLNDKLELSSIVLPDVGYRFTKDGWEHEVYNLRDKANNQKIYFRNLNTNDEYNISAKEFDKQLKEGKISFTQTSNLRFAPGPGVELKKGDFIELNIKEGEQSSQVQGKFVAIENFGQIIHLEDALSNTFSDGKNEVSQHDHLELNVLDAVNNTIIEPIKVIETSINHENYKPGTKVIVSSIDIEKGDKNHILKREGIIEGPHGKDDSSWIKVKVNGKIEPFLKVNIERFEPIIKHETRTYYSRQLDKFIESKPFANTYFRQTDSRTHVSYYQDNDGLIHSSSFNYSIIGSSPVTVEQFKICMAKDPETKVSFVNNLENQNQLNINSQTLNNEVMKKNEEVQEQNAPVEVKTDATLKFNEQGVKGNLVKAPVIKELESGKKMAQFTVGINETTKTGKVVTNFVDCSAFGKQAEKIESLNLEKGAYLEVGGKANFYETDVKDGNGKNYHNSINVNYVQVLGKEKGSNAEIESKFERPNHIEIKGNLTKAPEYKDLPGGKLVAEVTIAHNYKVGEGPEDKRVMYINANVYGKAAEAMKKNELDKGSSLGLKGSIENQSYVDKDGHNRQNVKVNSNFVELSKSKEKVEDKEVTVDVQAETKSAKKGKAKGKEM
jgi:single stranded DNA-binding protein